MQIWQKFLLKKEVQDILIIISKLKKNASVIHGDNRKMLKLIKNLSALKIDLPSRACLFSNQDNNIDFNKLIDCSIIWTEPKTKEQVWHMDALKRFAVVNVILTSDIPTEFLDVQYINKNQDSKDFDYPLKWPLNKKQNLEIKSGDAIFFWSNMIHRGPANINNEDRISLYLTFALKGQKQQITTDFAFPNWAWIDSKFENSTTLKRSHFQIDFIIMNDLLDLYPLNWHNDNIHENVSMQVQERQKFISTFPIAKKYFLLFWSDSQFYLTKIEIDKNENVCIHYYPTLKHPKATFEKITLEKFNTLEKIEINIDNLQELQGFSLYTQKGYTEKKITDQKCIFYSFSHLVLKEKCEISIPHIFHEGQTIFVHPLILF